MKKLRRSERDKKFLGVCGGMAEYLNMDSTLIRIMFLVFAALAGSGLLFYLIIALVMPTESQA